jgi:hypothetical protein
LGSEPSNVRLAKSSGVERLSCSTSITYLVSIDRDYVHRYLNVVEVSIMTSPNLYNVPFNTCRKRKPWNEGQEDMYIDFLVFRLGAVYETLRLRISSLAAARNTRPSHASECYWEKQGENELERIVPETPLTSCVSIVQNRKIGLRMRPLLRWDGKKYVASATKNTS